MTLSPAVSSLPSLLSSLSLSALNYLTSLLLAVNLICTEGLSEGLQSLPNLSDAPAAVQQLYS